jgi:apolipoprotein N-acyltransferase
MRTGLLFLLPVASALLVTASFPPFGLMILAWLGLSPLLFALRQKGFLVAAALGFLFGCVFGIGAFSWAVGIPPIRLSNFYLWLSAFSLYFLFFGLLYRLISARIGSWVIIGAPALWLVLEYVRSNLFFLAWPWNLLGHSQYCYLPVIQIADFTGVYGISFLIVTVNQCLSQIPDFIARRRGVPSANTTGSARGINWTGHIVTVALVLTLTFFYGWYRIGAPEDGKHIRVAVVQANVVARDNMPLADQAKHLRPYRRLTTEAAMKEPDLIVWPASSLPGPIRASRFVRITTRDLARETGSYLLVGGAGRNKLEHPEEAYQSYSNSEFLISPSGRVTGQYNKIWLLPFNEYLPLQGKITWPEWITTLQTSFLPGEEYTLFQVLEARFGTPICWENMFPALFRRFVKDGAQFMISVTNEAFMGPTAGPYQSLAINVFRAVENRVAIVRASPTGVSCFISRNGEIVERVKDSNGTDLFVAGFLVRDVPLSNNKTFYTVYGDVFAWSVISVAALIIVFCLCPKKRTRHRLRS